MHIQPNRNGSPESVRRAFEQARAEVQRESQDRVRGARAELARLSKLRHEKFRQFRAQAAEASTSDRVEISDHARMLASEQSDASAEHAERVKELRAEFEAQTLHTPERLEEAARRMLGQEAE